MFKIVICDDNISLCKDMEYLIKGEYDVDIKIFHKSKALLDYFASDIYCDILFLDIEIDELSGIDIAEKIRFDNKIPNLKIVFISGKEEYAMKLFKLRPYDFLLKPFTKNEIVTIIENILNETHIGNGIYFHNKNEIISGDLNYITYFDSSGRKVTLHFVDGTKKEITSKLSEVIAKYNCSRLIQIHKSYLVNLEFIKTFTFSEVELQDGNILPISRNHRKDVRDQFFKEI